MSADPIGYIACLLVFATFYMRTLTPMRLMAIASNLAFIAYGYLDQAMPIMLLHLALLPLNLWRLLQCWPAARKLLSARRDRPGKSRGGLIRHFRQSALSFA